MRTSRWRGVTLGDLESESRGVIQTGPFGSQLHASDYSEIGTPVVMPTNIRDLRVSEVGIARVSEDHVDRLARHTLQAGDVVYSRRGDVEKCALITEAQAGWLCGTGCLLVRVQGPTVDARFLSYALALPSTRSWISQHAVGATMPNLNTEVLRAVPIRLPSIEEQQQIASTLGALDDRIDSNRRALATLAELARATFVEWRTNQSSLRATTFGEFADVFGGSTPKTGRPEFWDGQVAWATPTDVTSLGAPYLYSTARKITDEGLASCAVVLHPAGTIFMTSRASIGYFAVNEVPSATNQGFIAVRPKRTIDLWFVFEEMRSRVGEFIDHANGSTFLEISRGTFKALPLLVPDDAAISSLQSALTPLHSKASQLVSETYELVRLRDALLPELLSGAVWIRGEGELIA